MSKKMKAKDKADGGKCTIDCNISVLGGDHKGGCADCTHRDDFINKYRKPNAENGENKSE